MSPIRLGTAVSTLAVATALSGCAIGFHPHSQVAGKNTGSNLGLATRAALELQSNNTLAAVSFAEQAVEAAPREATLRLLLANCYFAAGRFQSAETAYRDSLSLVPNQPQAVLKLALVQIAQGKSQSALGYLEIARDSLDPADYGLAIALAGRPADAVMVLQQAARAPGADSRVRQNLALAYGLAGDWAAARAVAAQDVSPDQVDGRIKQWMLMASPKAAYDQVAALTGITPVVDSGEPQRLALKDVENPLERYAEAASQKVQQTASVMLPESAAPAPVTRQPVAAPEPQPLPEAPPEPMPSKDVAQADELAPAPQLTEAVKQLVRSAPASVAPLPTKFEKAPAVPYVAISDEVRKAAARARGMGRSTSVVQLGAYTSPKGVAAAWNKLSRSHRSLDGYRPVSARFVSAKGTFYRLAVKGFASPADAKDLCSHLRTKGQSCFVRQVAGDAPVQMASR
jgi:Flp pilus assembly protein TadD